MSTFTPAPKHLGRLDADERLAAKVDRLLAKRRQRKPLNRSWLTRGTTPLRSRTPIAKVNRARQAKRRAAYAKVLRSDFHKRLRYQAWERSRGRCECEDCVLIRGNTTHRLYGEIISDERRRAAWAEIPVWFATRGGEPWRRFRCDEGETHHLTYQFFGQENPVELQHVRFVWINCHRRIEAENHTRRTYLRGAHA